jgi:hypothetical protein
MRARRRPDKQAGGLKDASDPKTVVRLRKLMAALDIPENAAEIRFTLGDEPTVTWLMERS